MKDFLEKKYDEESLLLFQEIAIWEDYYREKYCGGKADNELLQEGWRKNINGDWCSEKMEIERRRKFGKKLEELGYLKLFQVSKDLRLMLQEVNVKNTSSEK